MKGKFKVLNNMSSTMKKFFISYILILLIPFFVFLGMTNNLSNTMEKNASRETEFVVEDVMQEFYHRIDEKDKLFIELSQNKEIVSIGYNDYSIYDVENTTDLIMRLQQLDISGEEMYVFFPSSEAFVSDRGVYNRIDSIYGEVISYGGLNYQEFEEQILDSGLKYAEYKEDIMTTNSIEHRGVLFAHNVEDRFTLLSFMDTSFIEDTLGEYLIEVGGEATIRNRNGEVIYESIPVIERENQPMYTYEYSEIGSYVLETRIPTDSLYKDVRNVQLLFVLVFAAYLVFSTYLAWVLSKRNVVPIQRIVELCGVDSDSATKNEFEVLETYMQKTMKEKSLRELIIGKCNRIEEVDEGLFGEFIYEKNFCIAVLDISTRFMEMEEYNDIRNYMYQIVESLHVPNTKVVELNLYQLAIVFYGSGEIVEFTKKTKADCRKLVSALQEVVPCQLRIGLGDTVHSALQMGYSFVQAKCAVRACIEYDKSCMEYEKLPREKQRFYLPDQLREMLLKGIECGNQKQVGSILKILYIENFETRDLSIEQKNQLFEEMNMIVRHYRNAGCSEEVIVNDEGDATYFQKLSDVLLKVCGKRTDLETEEKKKIQEGIKEYIDQHYMDSNICLASVASYFKITESYLSYSFKKMYQVNFSVYLENKRIEEACILLLADSSSIEEVCQKVGYNSAHVFRRAFRKIKGYNPSEIRKNKK